MFASLSPVIVALVLDPSKGSVNLSSPYSIVISSPPATFSVVGPGRTFSVSRIEYARFDRAAPMQPES